jgi:phosphate starvation-inducible protein PhoH and related proteins
LGKRASRKTVRTAAKIQSLFPAMEHDERHGSPWNDQPHYTRNIRPRSARQASFIDALESAQVVVALGPAGTGKTYLAVAKAVQALEAGSVRRIVLCRPAVEAGENLGYLPGDICAKLAPYLRPLYDALSDRLGGRNLKHLLADDTIEIAPVAYMRGRTLSNAFIVVDEAQNCTYGQLKMLLTRLGPGSTLVITGDPDQTDLLSGLSGLGEVADRLERIGGVSVIRMDAEDVVRHPLVAEMLSVL